MVSVFERLPPFADLKLCENGNLIGPVFLLIREDGEVKCAIELAVEINSSSRLHNFVELKSFRIKALYAKDSNVPLPIINHVTQLFPIRYSGILEAVSKGDFPILDLESQVKDFGGVLPIIQDGVMRIFF